MKVLIVLSALCAAALASPVNPVLLPKVHVAPAQVTVVKQPHVVQEPEPVLRHVPVPYKAVSYTAPHVVPGPVITPVVHHEIPVVHAPVAHAPVLHAPVAHAPVLHAPVAHAPVLHAPVAHAPVLHAPVVHAPAVPYGHSYVY